VKAGSYARIGLLGGTFDPIHIGHLRLARLARRRLGLERVLLQPALYPGHRPGPPASAASHRAAMVALATQRDAGLELLPPEFGMRRNRPTYTVEVLEALRKALPRRAALFFLLGVDAFLDLASWHRWRELSSLATLVVADRPGYGAAAAEQLARRLGRPGRVGQLAVEWLDGVLSPVSATQVRARARRGLPLRGHVAAAVELYIMKYGLYGTRTTRYKNIRFHGT
jgi:nicotinate-nucleotide adenylyltransferase